MYIALKMKNAMLESLGGFRKLYFETCSSLFIISSIKAFFDCGDKA
jgi:hypothetical protein